VQVQLLPSATQQGRDGMVAVRSLDKLEQQIVDDIELLSNKIYQIEHGKPGDEHIDRLKMIPIVEEVLKNIRDKVIEKMGG
jgi:hypothetical protein